MKTSSIHSMMPLKSTMEKLGVLMATINNVTDSNRKGHVVKNEFFKICSISFGYSKNIAKEFFYLHSRL
jgi:hypothetical protein